MLAVTAVAGRWMRDCFSYGKIDGLAPTDRNSNMKLRKLLGECCPQYASRLEDMKFQKAQKILAQLKSEANTILTVLGWTKQMQKHLDNAAVVDVSEVGEQDLRHGRMNPDKFKHLSKEQRDSWVEFHQKLFHVAQKTIVDSDSSIQILGAFKEILALVVEPIEAFGKRGLVSQKSIASLRERYFKFAQTIKSEGRIRVRYLRILQDSHNVELFEKWNEQLQREFKNADRRADAVDDFLAATRAVVSEIVGQLSTSEVDAEQRRHDLAIVKSKLEILKHRMKSSQDQANSWAERAAQAEKADLVADYERRKKIFETSAHLYKECVGILEKLQEKLNSRMAAGAV